MLSKKYLLNREEINLLTSKKIGPIQGKYFGLVFKTTEELSKFGVIISNKISPKAVQRNKIKRLLYRAVESKLLGKNGLFLFLAKKSCVDRSLEEFEREMEGFKNKLVVGK